MTDPSPPASGRGEGPPPAAVALRGLCPRCGSPTLFDGIVRFAPKCRACGLDFSSFNVGDGPAAFLIFIVGGIVTALAIAVELSLSPPWWLHVLLWLPLTAALTLGLLRIGKGLLLALEFRHRAREGRPREDR
ncbi:DUF983 domain-containing protein [Sphingosinicella sp.]|uniref:DUF983 domain-containing protein n=1 Tax=Sphingosinicella sp. TaxID=1917971 RepID=UPI0040379BFB